VTPEQLVNEVEAAQCIVIVGGPSTGKSTLAHRLKPSERVRCTDELVGVLEWSEASAEVARWLDEPGPWVIEGVATARALRKWLLANPGKPLPCTVVLMARPLVELSKGQAAMGKGVATVWNEIAPDVLARGARVVRNDGPPAEQVRESREGSAAPPQ